MTSCYICGNELLSLEIDSRDNKIKPCHKCQAVIQKCVEQMESRDKRKQERAESGVWLNPVTGEYSMGDIEDIEELPDDDSEFITGFKFHSEQEEQD